MANSRNSHTDVLVVGAGPVGLMMAGELARHGIKPRIIEKAPAPSDKSKAFGIHARTMEIFENLGIVERFLKEGNICNGLNFYDEGKELAEIDLSHIESKYPFVLILAQSITERLLAEHLYSFGIEVERETELIGFEQSSEEVTARVKRKDGGEELINCAYLVGCDGAHSTTRHLLKLDFKGDPYPNYWLLADCDIKWQYPKQRLAFFIHPKGSIAYFPFVGDRGRLIFELPHAGEDVEQSEPTIEDVKRLADERGLEYESIDNPVWVTYFKIHHRIVNRYNIGRVFIAGDAAHILSPVGGQGMNTGIGDAVNLAWKLASVLHGWAAASLLDTYEPERIAFARRLVATTDRAFTIVTSRGRIARWVRVGVVPRVLPIVFEDKLPKRPGTGYERIGFLSDGAAHGRPIGTSFRPGNGDRVGLNCATCHVGTIRDTPDSPRRVVLGMPANQMDLQGYARFLTACAQDPRFNAGTLIEAIQKENPDFGFFSRLFYRLFTTPPREFRFWGGPCLLAEDSLRLNVNMLLLESARAADEASRDAGV